MKLIIFIGLLTILSVHSLDLQNYSFKSYLNDFQKSYSQEEQLKRQMIFQQNLQDIIQHNSNPHRSYSKGINQFTDQTPLELKAVNGYHKEMGYAHRQSEKANLYQYQGVELPTNFDWRTKNVVTAVKDQGRCGSCWTFAAAESVESHWAIQTGSLWDLSEQQIADCTVNTLNCGGTGGCSGGIAQVAYEGIIAKGGLASEWTYPYTSYQGDNHQCGVTTKTPGIAQVTGYTNIKSNSYNDLIEALATVGPISVSIDASSLKSYAGGVFDGCDTSKPDINHAVLLVGYGVDPLQGPYWLIRNSWGAKWGEGGYFRLRRTGDNLYCGVDVTPQNGSGCDGGPDTVYVCGMCGILYDNTFPTFGKSISEKNVDE